MADHVPYSEKHRYGPHFLNRFDYYKNTGSASTPAGGRPWILLCPFSGFRQGSRESVRLEDVDNVTPGNQHAIHYDFIEYFLDAARPTPYDIFVCEVNQVEPRTFIPNEATDAPERTMYYPENVNLVGHCFQYIKSHPTRWQDVVFGPGYQLNPDKGVIYGTSAGATYSMLIAYRPSLPFFTAGLSTYGNRYPVTVSSKPAAVVNRNGQSSWQPNDSNTYLDSGSLIEGFVGMPGGMASPSDGHMPDEFYAQFSPLSYINSASPPTVSVYDSSSNVDEPYTNFHDKRMGDDIKAALDAVGVTNELYQDNPVQNAMSATNLARVYSFLQSTLGYP